LRKSFRYPKSWGAVTSGLQELDERLHSKDLYLETDGARLRYRDEGRGPAVVFIHGWSLDLDMWEFQAEALRSSYRVVRLDRRGFGLSSGSPSLAQDAVDIVALCRSLQLGQLALVGMSQGARVALHLASAASIPISCLVLDGIPDLAATGAAPHSNDMPHEHYRRVAQRDGMSAFRREWAMHPLTRLQSRDQRAQEIRTRMIERYSGRDLLGPEATLQFAASSAVTLPTLLLNGDHDLEGRRRFAKQLASELPLAVHVDIAEAGHLCNLDNPRAYNEELRRFLESHPI
jgi:pimeloyl-ACP methyl ester carboxylesterase